VCACVRACVRVHAQIIWLKHKVHSLVYMTLYMTHMTFLVNQEQIFDKIKNNRGKYRYLCNLLSLQVL